MVRGSCLCGGVAFEIDAAVTPIQLCHARRCQKVTGSAFSPELAAPREGFRWTRGAELLTHYEAPLLREPPPFRRSFCRHCGSPMPVELEGTDWIVVLAGVLDDDPGTRPFRRIFTGQAAPWDEIGDDLPRFDAHAPASQQLPRREPGGSS